MLYYNIAFKAFCLCIFFSLIPIASAAPAQDSEQPLLVTSIKPLAIIAQSAFEGALAVEYIMPAALSPHDVVIKLSDVRRLAAADMVLWIGPEFEVRSAKQFSAVDNERLITAMDVLELNHEESTETGKDDEADHHHEDDHHHDIDPHIWLSPPMAEKVVETLAQRLNIPHKRIFSDKAKAKIEKLLFDVKKGNYIVHHQGFGYFIEEFNLQSGLSIRDMMGKQQGAKTQYNLRLEAEKRGVSCVFIEPQHGQKDAVGFAKDLAVPTTTIDILAVASKGQLPSYESYMLGLAKQFSSCFKK